MPEVLRRINRHITAVFTDDGFTFGNCLLVDDDVRLLIDSGAGRALDTVDLSTIDILANTHHHIDHVRGNALCCRAEVLVHPLERPGLQSVARMTATSGWNDLMNVDVFARIPEKGMALLESLRPHRVDGDLHDGQVIDCGHTRIEVLHTPGHSAGHCSFLFPDEDLVFLGDICLTTVGPWYGEPQADIEEFIGSVNRIIELRPRMLVTGHVPRVIAENTVQVLTEYRDRILRREDRILKRLKNKPSDIHQLATEHLIYRQHPTPFVLFWEKSMLKKHIERLQAVGYVEPLGDGRYRAL